jgi:hypothetical protein
MVRRTCPFTASLRDLFPSLLYDIGGAADGRHLEGAAKKKSKSKGKSKKKRLEMEVEVEKGLQGETWKGVRGGREGEGRGAGVGWMRSR